MNKKSLARNARLFAVIKLNLISSGRIEVKKSADVCRGFFDGDYCTLTKSAPEIDSLVVLTITG